MRKTISSNWSNKTRDDINENFEKLFNKNISSSEVNVVSPINPNSNISEYPDGISVFYETQDSAIGSVWESSLGVSLTGGWRFFVETVKDRIGGTISAIQRVHVIQTSPLSRKFLYTFKRAFYGDWGDWEEINKQITSEDINHTSELYPAGIDKFPVGVSVFYTSQNTDTGKDLKRDLGLNIKPGIGYRFICTTFKTKFLNTYSSVQTIYVYQTSPKPYKCLYTYQRFYYGSPDTGDWGVWERIDSFEGLYVASIGDNLFDISTMLSGRYYDRTDGNITLNNKVNCSDLIPVLPGGKYYKEYPGQVAYFDIDKEFVIGYNIQDPTLITIPDGPIRYMSFSFNQRDSEKVSLIYMGGAESNDYMIIDSKELMLSENIPKTSHVSPIVNSETFLRIPTPYDDGDDWEGRYNQATHPSIYQFDNEWNGYKFWLAFTPYPKSLLKTENPCVVASNDGVNWEVPEGVTNPLDEAPSTGYNSDTHILYNSSSNKLEIWYRAVTDNSSREYIKRVTSGDGVNWSDPETMLSNINGSNILQLISPSVIYENNEYVMWVMRDWFIYRSTSRDGKSWGDWKTITDTRGHIIHSWHPNIQKIGDKYYMTNCEKMSNQGDGGDIFYSESDDGIVWSTPFKIIGFTGNDWDFDGHGVYRSSMMIKDSNVYIYYGMFVNSPYGRRWTLGLTTGRDIYNLKGISERAILYS